MVKSAGSFRSLQPGSTGIAFSGLGDIPPEDADLSASRGLEGEPASRFPLPTVAALPASLSRAVALRPKGCTPLGTPAGSKRTCQIRSASGLRSPRPADGEPCPLRPSTASSGISPPSFVRRSHLVLSAKHKSVGWGHGRDGPSGRGGFSPHEADFEEIRARMSERTGILDLRHLGQDHQAVAQSKFASYEPADEIGEGAALKTRPGARPSRPGLLASPHQDLVGKGVPES